MTAPSTSTNLLQRVRHVTDKEAWDRFVHLYTPLLFHWAVGKGLQPADAEDLVQDVFGVLVKKLPEFVYDKRKSFRSWLWTVFNNRWYDRQRHRALPLEGAGVLAEVAGPDGTQDACEAEYRQFVVGQALEVMRAHFQPDTWKAFWEFVVSGKPAAQVAAELRMSIDSVYTAKHRVLRRLREELDGLLD